MNTFEKFSGSAKKVLRLAQEETLASGYAEIEPAHLLLGVLRESEGRGAGILRELDVNVTAFCEQVREALTLQDKLPPERAPGLSERSKEVITQVVHLCNTPLGETVESEHFLLALLYKENDLARELLNTSGITAQRVQEHLNLPSSKVEPVAEPPVKQAAGHVSRGRRLARARTRAVVAWFVWLALIFFLGFWYHVPIMSFLVSSVITILDRTPFLLAHPRPEWYPWLALWAGLFGYALWFLLTLPLYWAYGFWIPGLYADGKKIRRLRRFHQWLALHAMNQGLIMVKLLVSLEGIYALFSWLPATWWVWSTLYYGLFSLIWAYLMPILILPLSYKLTLITEGPHVERLALLLKQTRMRIDGLYLMEPKDQQLAGMFLAANVYLVYWGRQKRIMATNTVFHRFPLDELEVILAHELGHLVHQDIPKRVAWRALFLGVFLFFCQQVLFVSVNPSVRLIHLLNYVNVDPMMSLSVSYCFLFGIYCCYQYLHRCSEHRADEYALQVTQKVDTFKSAMMRLTKSNRLLASQPKRQSFTATHPSLQKRLEHADAFAKRHSIS